MNKTHKEIARIIKEHLPNGNPLLYKQKVLICIELANHFEREYKEELERTEERFKEYKEKNESFNRKDFLKECGVEK